MTIRAEIFTKLAGSTGVSALVGSRIYRSRLPQGSGGKPTYPAIVYRRLSGQRVRTLDGSEGQAEPTFEIVAFANTQAAAESVSEAVRGALDDWQSSTGTVTIRNSYVIGETDIYNDGVEAYQISLDYQFFHDE